MANFEVYGRRLDKKVMKALLNSDTMTVACFIISTMYLEVKSIIDWIWLFSICGGQTLIWNSTSRRKLDGSWLTGQR